MEIAAAQREMRDVYLNGSVGTLVSGLLWIGSAVLGQWGTERQAIIVLVFGGMFIFPIMRLLLKMMGRRASLSPENPLRALSMQVAFTVPLVLPVAGGAALYELNWFYPACMIIVGAHYLPFVTMYGLKLFGILGGAILAAGLIVGLYFAGSFTTGGWICGATLLVFAALLGATRETAAD